MCVFLHFCGASCNQERELERNCAGAFPVALIQRLGYAAWSFSPSNGQDRFMPRRELAAVPP
jgi:hypothetical protein